MKKFIWLSLLVGFSFFHASPTLATPFFLNLVPSSLTVVPAQPMTADIVISGLAPGGPPSVGAFDLDVSFASAILSPTGVTFGSFLGIPGLEALTDFKFLPGLVDLAEVSLLSPSALDALQPASFTLATLSFTALASGTTTLTFSQIIVDDAFGNRFLIPGPSTLLLLGTGLVGLRAVAWRRSRRK